VIVAEDVADAVLTAYNRAREAGQAPVDCYRAGVKAWRDRFPDQAPEYAAKQAVALILRANVRLRVEED
jgi:uncharacterized protein YcbX